MQRLNAVLDEMEKRLSYKQLAGTMRGDDDFDFEELTQSPGTDLPEGFEVGVLTSLKNESIPAFLPFSGSNGIALSIDQFPDFAFFNELLERSTFQILKAIDCNNFRLTLIDGKNHGVFMSHFSRLDHSVTGGVIYEEPERINTVLNEILLSNAEEYRFVIINNFPAGFTTESAAVLIRILNIARDNKIRILITKESTPVKTMADLDASISAKLEVISFSNGNQWFSKTLSGIEGIKELFILNFGSSFTEAEMSAEIEAVNAVRRTKEHTVEESFEINEGIKIPVGSDSKGVFYFRLGHNTSNYHAIVGGRSGKGKTVFLDNIIARAATLYSPDELRFALLDMKGIEFNDYINLPHVQAFSSSSNFENGLKVIEFLQKNLKEREVLFNGVKANNIVDYRKKSGKVMPRLLVIVDEFQNLFTGNYKTDGFVEDVLIKQILRIGRAYGVHLLCCTQSLGDGVRSSFLNNIPLRIAFQMTQDQSRSFLSINNAAAQTLKVGQAIYNGQDGLLSENVLIKIDHLQSEHVRELMAECASRHHAHESFEKMIVLK